MQHLVFLSLIIFRGVMFVQTFIRTRCLRQLLEPPGFCYHCRCQAFLRGLLGAIPVTSCGVNLLEDSYQQHVMFAFPLQLHQPPHSQLGTLQSTAPKGHFYLEFKWETYLCRAFPQSWKLEKCK